jgi:hypothetical protein
MEMARRVSEAFAETDAVGSKVAGVTVSDIAGALKTKGFQMSSQDRTEMKRQYRVKELLGKMYEGNSIAEGFGCVEQFLCEFSEKNPNAVHNIEFTEDATGNKCFKRAFLMEPNLAHAMLHNKIRITTIDAGHISHKLYTGVAMLLEMMDGNGRLFPVAAAIAPTESEDNYTWFFEQVCKYPGMREFLQREGHVFLSNRDKGLEAAMPLKRRFHEGFFANASSTSNAT